MSSKWAYWARGYYPNTNTPLGSTPQPSLRDYLAYLLATSGQKPVLFI